jgi:hypothetical protein
MPLAQTYFDGYLAPLVTPERETRATQDVAAMGTLPADHAAKLVVLRTYIITCLESQKSPDDVFAAKLASYRKEHDSTLKQAVAAQSVLDAASGNPNINTGASFYTVGLYRS